MTNRKKTWHKKGMADELKPGTRIHVKTKGHELNEEERAIRSVYGTSRSTVYEFEVHEMSLLSTPCHSSPTSLSLGIAWPCQRQISHPDEVNVHVELS